jgi:tetratricopeptide (TPR) repeat protein
MMHPSLLIVLVGLLFMLGFYALSFLRRQGLATRFLIEGVGLTAIFALVSLYWPINFLLFLVILYLITMRVRLLIDIGTWLTSKQRYDSALKVFDFALRLGTDEVTNKIVLINRGVALLRKQEAEEAYTTLKQAMSAMEIKRGARYQAAGYYNLGLACRRTDREPEAIRCFNLAIDALPSSVYGKAAGIALKKGKPVQESDPPTLEEPDQ